MSLALNFERKCRTCGTDILELTCGIPIFGSGLQLDHKLRRYLGLNLSLHDDLPKCLCATCFIKIESIDKFAVLTKKTEEAYLGWFKYIRANVAKHYSPSLNAPPANIPVVPTSSLNTTQKIDLGTLKKVVDDQISNNHTNTVPARPCLPTAIKPEVSTISYSDLKLGLLIKDQELLKLILKALKWAEHDQKASFEVLIQRLKNTTFREILSNNNLLNDSDLTQLLKSYIGQEAFSKFSTSYSNNRGVTIQPVVQTLPMRINTNDSVPADSSSSATAEHSGDTDFQMDEESVTQMEVGVDPSLFLDDEESQSKSKLEAPSRSENVVTIKLVPVNLTNKSSNEKMIPAILKCDVRNNGRYVCTNCPDTFATSTELQHHIVTSHLLNVKNPIQEETNEKKMIKIRVKKTKTKSVTTIAKPPVNLITPSIPISIPPTTTITVIPCAAKSEETVQVQASVTPERKQPIESVKVPSKTKRKRESRTTFKIKLIPAKRTRSQNESAKQSKLTCTICNKRVSTKSILKTHMNSHKIKGRYNCEKCGRVFKTSQNLSRHKQYHTGGKFACDRCRRVYPTSSTLKAHKISHSDARPHKCTICDKTFKRNQDLKFHLNQHTGARPYKCPHCPKSFASSGNCFSHRKRIHTNESSATDGKEYQTTKTSRKS